MERDYHQLLVMDFEYRLTVNSATAPQLLRYFPLYQRIWVDHYTRQAWLLQIIIIWLNE